MIGLTILGGYLGVGKTTLLNHILRDNNTRQDSMRIALLINDFGDINIDAQLIESMSDKQINLANGCVCCTLNDGFTDALDRLLALDPQPEHIILEASGVADVGNLSQYGNGQALTLANVVVVADAETVQQKATDRYVSRTIQRQLKAADLIVLNKTDLLNQTEQQELRVWLDELTEAVPVVPCVRCEIPIEMIMDIEHRQYSDTDLVHDHKQKHEHYSAWSYNTGLPISKQSLETFAASLGPDVLRCKGLFIAKSRGSLELQIVGKRSEILLRGTERENSEIVAIGLRDQLDTQRLEHLAAILFGPEAI